MSIKHLGQMGSLAVSFMASIVALGLVSSAKADLLAYEGFDYTTGAGLLGLNGGTGSWTSAWDDLQGGIGADAVQADSLSYMDSMGNELQTVGGKLLNTGIDGTSTGGRSLERRSSGSTWISFLAQRDGPEDGDPTNGLYPRGANLATFDLSDQSGANQERLNIGPKNSNSYWNDPEAGTQVDYVQFRYPAMNTGVLEENLPNLATNRPTPNIGTAPAGNFNGLARDAFAEALVQDVNLYVIRIDHLGDEMTADDIRVWINPRLDETPSDSAVSFAYIGADLQAAADLQMVPAGCTVGGGDLPCSPYGALNFGEQSFDRIRMFAGNAGSVPHAEILFDELRVATTFADAAPIAGPTGLPGDYNDDMVVDAADYTVWRDNLGAANEDALNGNGDGINGVDAGDYALWKSSFGDTTGPGSASAVPEPTAVVLIALTALGLASFRRRSTAWPVGG